MTSLNALGLTRLFHTDSSRGAANPDADKEEDELRRRLYVSYRLRSNSSLTQYPLGVRKPQQNKYGIGGLIIDNYDSFTYNLAHCFGELGAEPLVRHHDKITIDEIAKLAPKWLCISPGPGNPSEAGISKEVVRAFAGKIPLLGVCLGHQCIAEVFGGNIVRASRLLHGKTSPIYHNGQDLFKNLPHPFEATRYHSLLVERATLPDCLEITAWTAEGEIMGLRHRNPAMKLWGVQFHPESILTTDGKKLLNNFLQLQ